MAYTINLTDGTIFATVPDGTIDTTSSVTLVGRNYVNYGEFVAENFIQMLENHADINAPANPLIGQLWYDSTTNASALNVYDGLEWKTLGTVNRDVTEPTTPIIGDMWYDVTNSQVKVYDGAEFILVGGGPGDGLGATGIEVDTVTSGGGTLTHVIVKLNVDGDIVGIISKDAGFTPDDPITGFATIEPGLQLSTDVADARFTGTASNAELLDGNAPSSFVSSITSDTMNGSLGILNDAGVTVGAASDGELSVSFSNVFLKNNTSNGDLLLQVNSGGLVTVIECDGVTGKAKVAAPTPGTDEIANANYVDAAEASAIATATQNASQVPLTPTGSIAATNVQAGIAELDTEKEPIFSKNTGFNLNVGTTAGTVAAGDHTHIGAGGYVQTIGDTMTGALTLPGIPTLQNHAATKEYVDRWGGHPGARVSKSTNGSGGIIYNPSVLVTWDVEEFDNHGWHTGGSGNLVVPSTLNGQTISGAIVSVEYSIHAVDYAFFDLFWYDVSTTTSNLVHSCNPQNNAIVATPVLGDFYSGFSGLKVVQPGDYFFLIGRPNFPVPLTSVVQANATTWLSINLHSYW